MRIKRTAESSINPRVNPESYLINITIILVTGRKVQKVREILPRLSN